LGTCAVDPLEDWIVTLCLFLYLCAYWFGLLCWLFFITIFMIIFFIILSRLFIVLITCVVYNIALFLFSRLRLTYYYIILKTIDLLLILVRNIIFSYLNRRYLLNELGVFLLIMRINLIKVIDILFNSIKLLRQIKIIIFGWLNFDSDIICLLNWLTFFNFNFHGFLKYFFMLLYRFYYLWKIYFILLLKIWIWLIKV
jgi:hypothetical protein